MNRKRRWLLYAVLLGLLVTAAQLFQVRTLFEQALAWLGGRGPWGGSLFVALYVVATVLLIPGSVLTLGAGALFGISWGSLYVSLGSTLGATGAFLVGRHLARDALARKLADNERFAAIDRAVAAEGWKIVFLARLSPVLPFTLLNYAFGLTRVKVSHYVLASWLGMMPGTVMYVYLGAVAKAAAGTHTRGAGEWVLHGVGLLATVVLTVFISRRAKKALAGRILQ